MSPHAANDVGSAEYHQPQHLPHHVTCWHTVLAMFSWVTNHLPRIGSLILGMRFKSQGEMSGEYCGCSNSSHPQRQSSCGTHSASCDLALSCRIIALSTRSGRLSRTPRYTCRTRKSL
ncbi:hypothetical protein TNCV_701191 [Trichonephila clavipes]|nr:hypothetical protein TNCV_701191 [Trichonephila clavipes]